MFDGAGLQLNMPSLDEIIRNFGASLSRVAASYEADPVLQQDLVQEILVAIHRALPSLREEDRLAPFIFRIAHNRSVTHVVRQAAQRRRNLFDHAQEGPETPEELLLADERSQALTEAVRQLPLRYRQVVVLTLEELSHAEIAETLGIGVSNVAVRVNRAKAMLRVLLDD